MFWGKRAAGGSFAIISIGMKEIWTLSGKKEVLKRKLAPHFFALISRQKNMKPEKASLHTAVKRCFIIRRIASYGEAVLHKTPFQMKQLHFIPLVKAFRYRFTCEVAACGGRMCFFLQRTWRCLKYIQLYYSIKSQKNLRCKRLPEFSKFTA